MLKDRLNIPASMTMKFRYTGIRVRDLKESQRFYTRVMGMKVIGRGIMSHGGKYVHLQSPGSRQRLELNWYPEDNRFYSVYLNGDEMDHLAFMVDDVRKRFNEILRKGAEMAVEPFEDGGFDIAFVKDPDGIWIELLGRIAPRKKR